MLYSATERRIEALSAVPEGAEDLHFDHKYPQGQWAQFALLLERNFTSYWRDPAYNGTRFIFALVMALLFGTILWQIGDDRYCMLSLTVVCRSGTPPPFLLLSLSLSLSLSLPPSLPLSPSVLCLSLDVCLDRCALCVYTYTPRAGGLSPCCCVATSFVTGRAGIHLPLHLHVLG